MDGIGVSRRVSCCYVCVDIWNGLYMHGYMRKIEVGVYEGLRFDRDVVKDCLARGMVVYVRLGSVVGCI